jgi:hypothetical protein
MQSVVMNPKFCVKEVGKLIKGSKKVFIWEFVWDCTPFRVEFYHSKVSNKRRLNVNGNKVLEAKDKSNEFKYDLTIKGKKLSIIQITPTMYDLIIDGHVFSRLSEGDKPSPEASVKPIEVEEPVENNVASTENRQSILDSLWGEQGNSLSASYGPIVNSKSEVRPQMEEGKEGENNVPNFDFVKVPIRSHSALNLMLFEPPQEKKQLGDLLNEINFFVPKVEMNKEPSKFQQKHSDVYFI